MYNTKWPYVFYFLFVLQDQVNEEEVRLVEAFLSADNHPELTLADIIIGKLKEKDAQVSSGFILIHFRTENNYLQ